MKKYAFMALAIVATLSVPALAETAAENQADINASVGAIHKDNKAIDRQHDAMAHNRAEKAEAKRTDDVGQQAASSAKLGVNHAVVGAKKAERSIDKEILDNDVDDQKNVSDR